MIISALPVMMDVISNLAVFAYHIPTDAHESDGTLEWDSTTIVLVTAEACGKKGIGFTYGDAAIALFIDQSLKAHILGRHPFDIAGIIAGLSAAVRNQGRAGLAGMAISAIDTALWDLKAKILGIPLCRLIGMVRDRVEVYGSGGFTSYSDRQLAGQLSGWAGQGFRHIKMKVGRDPGKDVQRVEKARDAIGPGIRLFVDANGAYDAKQSLEMAERFRQSDVTWFEEPVSADDLPGLRFVRDHVPASIRTAAGEYGYTPEYFLRMLEEQAVDILQADATRCGGITGMLKAAQLSATYHIPFSFHCAPALHLHPALCIPSFFIGEYFHDHVRIEQLLFDGVPRPVNGTLSPDLSAPGLGLELKHQDAAGYRIL